MRSLLDSKIVRYNGPPNGGGDRRRRSGGKFAAEGVLLVPFQVPLLVPLRSQLSHCGTITCLKDRGQARNRQRAGTTPVSSTQPLARSMFELVVPALFAHMPISHQRTMEPAMLRS